MIPIKTGDIVSDSDGSYVVRGIQHTQSGPVLTLSRLNKKVISKHASSIVLQDSNEKAHRIKSTAEDVYELTVKLPKSIDKARILKLLNAIGEVD